MEKKEGKKMKMAKLIKEKNIINNKNDEAG